MPNFKSIYTKASEQYPINSEDVYTGCKVFDSDNKIIEGEVFIPVGQIVLETVNGVKIPTYKRHHILMRGREGWFIAKYPFIKIID